MTDDKPRRAADTASLLPTDLAPPREKLFSGPRAVTARIDGTRVDAVFDLAFELKSADRRRLLAVTAGELQIIAAHAVRWGEIASHAAHLVELVDGDASIPAIVAAKEALYAVVRGHQQVAGGTDGQG